MARGLLIALLGVVPAMATNRVFTVTAPATAVAGSKVSVSVLAGTDAAGEHVGFFHGEYSVDGGKSWTAFCYEENLGASVARTAGFPAGAVGSKALVRVRIAYRGGKAGDVDFAGAPINWGGSWAKWGEPPAKVVAIAVVAP